MQRNRPRSLTADLVKALGDRIREGSFAAGDRLPRETDLMTEYGVSRTVVREAISRLQAAGMVETRHGIGSFAVGMGNPGTFRIGPDQVATLQDVIQVLELRIAVETESAGLAAARRTEQNMRAMRSALDTFAATVEAGRDAVGPDFQFHLEIARASQNHHFADLMGTLGGTMIPRARIGTAQTDSEELRTYLRRVNLEHESIFDAIARQDADAARAAMRTHLTNSRERRRKLLTG